jgi:hypothetical protein
MFCGVALLGAQSLALSPSVARAQSVCPGFPIPAECGQFATHAIGPNTSFLVQNNAWSDPGQCIQWKPDGSFCVSNVPSSGSFGFPNLLQGQVFGSGPTTSWSPVQVSNIVNWPITWSISGTTPTPSGQWNASIEFWTTTYNPTARTVNQPDGTELMVWLATSSGNLPGGLNVVGHAFVAGIYWNIYAGSWPTNQNTSARWNYLSYFPASGNIGSINADFSPFFANALLQTGAGTSGSLGPCKNATAGNSQCLDSAWWVTSVQAGFEVNAGGGLGLTSSNFTSHLNATPTTFCGRLPSGATLVRGQSSDSCNGLYQLTMQGDGNLVAYDTSFQPRWASGTVNGAYLTMQSDGNLVEYDDHNQRIWETGTASPGAYFLIQSDGNLVVYSASATPLWSAEGGLSVGAELLSGGWTYSYDGRFNLSMQRDGDLALYFGSTRLWDTGTNSGARVNMQGDGNLVVYDAAGNPLWDSGTWGNPGAHLALNNEGNLIIYATNGAVLWTSNTGGH